MFRPPSWLASRIAPTAAGFPAGQLRRLRPSRTCVVAFARIGYARRPTTGNWRHEDFHLARFTALSTAPSALLRRARRLWNRDPGLPWTRAAHIYLYILRMGGKLVWTRQLDRTGGGGRPVAPEKGPDLRLSNEF